MTECKGLRMRHERFRTTRLHERASLAGMTARIMSRFERTHCETPFLCDDWAHDRGSQREPESRKTANLASRFRRND